MANFPLVHIPVRSMSRLRSPRAPEHRYFDVRRFEESPFAEEGAERFVHSYAKYVLQRAKTFSAK